MPTCPDGGTCPDNYECSDGECVSHTGGMPIWLYVIIVVAVAIAGRCIRAALCAKKRHGVSNDASESLINRQAATKQQADVAAAQKREREPPVAIAVSD